MDDPKEEQPGEPSSAYGDSYDCQRSGMVGAMNRERRKTLWFGPSVFLALWFQKSTLIRALIVAAIVGPILTVINQYDTIMSGTLDWRFFLKLVLTFLVPYSVSSYSSVMESISSRHETKSVKSCRKDDF